MNERIKELMEQAVKDVDIVTGDELLDDELSKMYIPDCFAEKFAELIVQEVFNVIENERFEIYEPVVEKVKEHFGVK